MDSGHYVDRGTFALGDVVVHPGKNPGNSYMMQFGTLSEEVHLSRVAWPKRKINTRSRLLYESTSQ